ncbi:NAD-dependent epimerase/dehydratase family protein [Alkalihalobacillus sp. TS-13]|uniref:NAD-dependent epimerase/dehydratase family protein n=1 Tax=Alkalihalobacillus sp. TS-13 TaxID=2842455 RepID=UPI001C879C48|nr:NAD-dependent epimerase/dehydratase family protein [Alkalihalobacillus sp. TS-13]
MRRAVITGVAGFLGSNLATHLLNDGYEVIGIDNLSTGRKSNLKKLDSHPWFRFIETDVCHGSILQNKQLDRVDEVYHLASPASPKWYQASPFNTIEVNTIGTKNMLELTRRNEAKMLYSSTSEIYGDPEIHPQIETYKGNVNLWGPRACYDESKRLGEVYCYLFHNLYATKVTVARIFNTYSSGLWQGDGRVIPNFINQALRGENLSIYGTGMQTRTFCYIDDTIAAFKKMVESDKSDGEVFNIGHPKEYTILEVAKLIKKMTRTSSDIVFLEPQDDDPKVRCPDISKATALLDWIPKVELKEGLEHSITEYRSRIITGISPLNLNDKLND